MNNTLQSSPELSFEYRRRSQDIPISWKGIGIEQSIDTIVHVGAGSSDQAWQLFQLCSIATKAQMAGTFQEMLALEHIQGFTPLPHQVETAARVIRELRGRAILADEVGLGKTIEAGLVLKEYLLRGLVKKALILVPASLVLQWTKELKDKFRIDATPQRDEWTWGGCDIVVASLDTAKRPPHRDIVLAQTWDFLLIDEAHKLKNQRTKNWQMANAISSKYLLLLTATPIQNQLKELHTLVTLLRPGHLGNASEFTTQHVADRRTPKDADRLRETVSDVMIRNRRAEGGTRLPKRHVQVVELSLSPLEREFYERVQSLLKKEYEERVSMRVSILPLLTLQREICSSSYAALISLEKMLKRTQRPDRMRQLEELIELGSQIPEYTKIAHVLDLLEHIDDKCIIFTEYRATQDFIMYMLKKRGISSVPFRGGFKRGKKDWMKELFSRKAQVLVATESGGEGINLQFCHHMINYDLPWNPMRLEQRIGRIHRLGQTKECHVFNLATKDTIEQHIVEILYEKVRMFESVIGTLDDIVSNVRYDTLEKRVFEASMTSATHQDLGKKLQALNVENLATGKGR